MFPYAMLEGKLLFLKKNLPLRLMPPNHATFCCDNLSVFLSFIEDFAVWLRVSYPPIFEHLGLLIPSSFHFQPSPLLHLSPLNPLIFFVSPQMYSYPIPFMQTSHSQTTRTLLSFQLHHLSIVTAIMFQRQQNLHFIDPSACVLVISPLFSSLPILLSLGSTEHQLSII